MKEQALGPRNQRLAEFWRDESGQDIVEYALIAVFIGLGAVASLQGLTARMITVFSAVGTTVTGAV